MASDSTVKIVRRELLRVLALNVVMWSAYKRERPVTGCYFEWFCPICKAYHWAVRNFDIRPSSLRCACMTISAPCSCFAVTMPWSKEYKLEGISADGRFIEEEVKQYNDSEEVPTQEIVLKTINDVREDRYYGVKVVDDFTKIDEEESEKTDLVSSLFADKKGLW